MADRTRAWQLFKTRVAPLLMVVVLALVALRTCEAESSQIAVVVDFGGEEQRVRGVEVEYVRDDGGDRVGHMRLSYGAGGAPGPATQTLQLDDGRYTAVVKVETDSGVETFERRFHVEGEATVKFTIRPSHDDLK